MMATHFLLFSAVNVFFTAEKREAEKNLLKSAVFNQRKSAGNIIMMMSNSFSPVLRG